MTWTYSVLTLSTTPKDQVRLLIGDTDTTFQLMQNEEIEWLLSENSNSVLAAAIDCCEAIAAEFSKEADTKNGQLSVKASQRAEAYLILAAKLRKKIGAMADIFVGGATWDDVNTLDDDPSLVQPSFKQRQFSIFGTGQFDRENC